MNLKVIKISRLLLIVGLFSAGLWLVGGRILAEGRSAPLHPARPGLIEFIPSRAAAVPQVQPTTFFTDELIAYVPYQTFQRQYEHEFHDLAFAGFQYFIGAPVADFEDVHIDWSGSGSCSLAADGSVSCSGEITRFYALMRFSGVFTPTGSTFVLQTGGFNNGFAPDNTIQLTFPDELTITQVVRNADSVPVTPISQTANTVTWTLPMQDNSVLDVTFFDGRVREIFVPLAVGD